MCHICCCRFLVRGVVLIIRVGLNDRRSPQLVLLYICWLIAFTRHVVKYPPWRARGARVSGLVLAHSCGFALGFGRCRVAARMRFVSPRNSVWRDRKPSAQAGAEEIQFVEDSRLPTSPSKNSRQASCPDLREERRG